MVKIPDTHPDSIPTLPAARKKASGLGFAKPEHLSDRAVARPFKGARGAAEVGLNPPSPDDFTTGSTRHSVKKIYGKGSVSIGGRPSGSHLENNLREDKVKPVVWSGEKPLPYMKQRGPVHFIPK